MKKLFTLCLIPLLALCMMPVTGCTASQVNSSVAQIASYLPTVLALIQDGLAVYNAVGVSNPPVTQEAVSGLTTAYKDLANLQTEINTYLAATSSSTAKTTAWTNIQTLVDTLVTDSDTTLQLASVKNANSSATAIAALASIDAAVHVLDSVVTSAQTPTQVQVKATARTVKLKAISQLWSPQDKQNIAQTLGVSYDTAYSHAVAMGF